MKKDRFRVLPFAILVLFLVVYLLSCGFSLLRDEMHRRNGELQWQMLSYGDFATESMLNEENNYGSYDLISTDGDPQMVYRPGDAFYATNFGFRYEDTNRPGGAMTLYYTTSPGEEFSEAKRLWAEKSSTGAWIFDLSGRKYYALRFDPDTTGGILWRDWEITLNEPVPPWQHFIPSWWQIFLALLLPTAISAAARQLADVWRVLRRTRPGAGSEKADEARAGAG